MISQKEASESTNDHVAFWGYPISASKVPTFAMVSFRPHRRPTPFVERSRRDKPPVWGLSSSGFCKLFYNLTNKVSKWFQMFLFASFFTSLYQVFICFPCVYTSIVSPGCPDMCHEMNVRGTKTWFPNEPMKHQVDSPQYHLGHTTQHWKAFQILSKSHCMLDSNVWK